MESGVGREGGGEGEGGGDVGGVNTPFAEEDIDLVSVQWDRA